MTAGDRGPGASTVLLLVASIGAALLVVIGVAALVPPIGDLLAGWPVVVIVLVVGTLLVLWRALRP